MAQLPPTTPKEQDERYNPANELYEREFNAGGPAEAEKRRLSDGDQTDAADAGSAAAVREQEEAAGSTPNPMNYVSGAQRLLTKTDSPVTLAVRLRKLAPLTIAIVFIVAAGIIATVSLPGLILQHIEETITGALNDADPAIHVRTKLLFKLKADAVKNGFAESKDGKCNIKCKFSTVNEKMKTRMTGDTSPIKTELKEIFPGTKRYIITKMTFPDGTVVTNGADFQRAISNTKYASDFYRIFNPDADPLIANNWVARLADRFHVSKKSTLTGNDDKANREQLGRDLGLPDESGDTSTGGTTGSSDEDTLANSEKTLSDGINAGKAKFTVDAGAKASNVAAVACAAYDLSKAVEVAYSVQKEIPATGMFIALANGASDQRVGNATASQSTLLGNLVTQRDNNKQFKGETNPFFGKSFTDGAGYQMSAFSAQPKLTDRDKTYGLTPNGITGALSQFTGFLNTNGVVGPKALVATHVTCQSVNSIGGTIVQCLPEAAGGSVAPGVGNAVALLGCAIVQTAIGEIASQALTLILPGIISTIVKNDIGAVTTNIVGPAASNLARVGGGQILGSGLASMYGLMPGSESEVKAYKQSTLAERQSDIAVRQYDAKSAPFDASNQYSFLGSTIRSLGLLDMDFSSVASTGSWLASVIPRASNLILPSTFAASDDSAKQAALYTDSACADPSLVSIGAACDGLGLPSFTMSTAEMNADPADTAQKMMDMGAVDSDTGEPSGDDTGAAKDYTDYINNCTDRKVNYGQMSGSIQDDDYAWDSGYLCRCTESSVDNIICTAPLAAELHVFRAYAATKTLNDAADNALPPGATNDGDSADGANTAVDTSSIPNTCSNTTQTGSGITAYSGLAGSSLSARVNSAPNSNAVSFDAGTFTFSNFGIGGVTGFDVTQPGILGAGVGRTVFQMTPGSSTKKGSVPTKNWTTNPLYLMRISKDNTKLDCFTLKGSDQGHLYNGLRIDHASNVQVSNLLLDGVSPGDHNFPPGETFAINDWHGQNNVYKNVELNGENKDAAAFGTNSTTGGTWINSSAHDFKYSHGWAMWQQKGGATLENCTSVNNWNGVNLERVSGTVTLKNMTFGGNHTDIAGGDDQNDNLKLVIIDPILKGHSKITIGWWSKEMGHPNKWGKDNVKVIVNGVDKTSSMIDWKATGSD